MKKEKKQLPYPGLKAGSIYGTVIFFIIPLIAFFFGVMIHIVDSLRIARAKKDQD